MRWLNGREQMQNSNDRLDSTIDRLLKNEESRQEKQDLNKEQLEDMKRVCNALFSSDNGKLFMKYFAKMSRVYAPSEQMNPVMLAHDAGRRNVFLTVRALLDKEVRQELNID